MFDDLWWREEDADYIRHRSDRYPGATDLEVDWTSASPAPRPGWTARRCSGSRWTATAVRGAVGTDGEQTHLLAAATHGEQLVISQVQVGAKSNDGSGRGS